MTKSQTVNRYIIFWETKEEGLPESMKDQALIFATLLRMLESDLSVEYMGRCEGILRKGKYWYNGFVLFKEDHENVNLFCDRYKQYIKVTDKHRYKNIQEIRNCLSTW